ncbi:MAG: carbohydrate-binding protein, partial [Bacteroidaceae bacterium]|nr:carbohydrate-binding protein [Bacteroidaceae bacterium]
FNCHLGAVESHDAYAMNEAEDFNFVQNAQVLYSGNTDDGGGMVGPMRNKHYIGYRRVDFGSKPASHLDLRVNITLASSGINVFLDQPNAAKGILLCSVKGSDLVATRTWDTIRKMINQPVTGVHDIYFVATGSGQTNINWWQFQSLNPVYADLTNGQGTLTTSFAAVQPEALVDGDLTTACVAPIEEGSATWIQYQSPSPMLLNGYQLFSGSTEEGDPSGWSLQASDDGKNWETLHEEPDTTFIVRGQRYFADVQPNKAYTYYRLLFNLGETQAKFSLSEWQLLGHCIDESDLTADGGTIIEGNETLIDHIGKTTVPSPFSIVYCPIGNYTLSAYSITISDAAKAPTSWKLEGSANGTSYKLIDQRTDADFPYSGCTNVYRINPEDSYLYYRLTVDDEEAEITQWQLFGKPDFGTYYADVTTIATITASEGSDAEALIDDDGTTFSTLSGSNPYWDIATTIPVKVLGFSLVSANDASLDPQIVTLYGYDEDGTQTQISNKTLTFPARGSRLSFTTTTTKLFKQFRLQVDEAAGSSVRLADFELYGAAVAEKEDPILLMPTNVVTSAAGLSNTEQIARVYDCNRSTNYRATFAEPVIITYTFDQPVSINAYSITASKNEPTRDPASWVLEAANISVTNSEDWTVLDSRSEEIFSHRYATQFYILNEESRMKNEE